MTTVNVLQAVDTDVRYLPEILVGTVVTIQMKSAGGSPVSGMVLKSSTAEQLKIFKFDGKILRLDPRLIESVSVTEA